MKRRRLTDVELSMVLSYQAVRTYCFGIGVDIVAARCCDHGLSECREASRDPDALLAVLTREGLA